MIDLFIFIDCNIIETVAGYFIVYTDYEHALVVFCVKLDRDNKKCAPGFGSMYAYTRDSGHANQAAIDKLLQAADTACISRKEFVLTPHTADCDLRHVPCSIKDLPAQQNFDFTFVSI